MRKRVLIAGLFHETHTFVAGGTRLRDFTIRQGEGLLAARGDASPLDGVLEVAETCGWELIPSIDMRASPSGTVADEAVDFFWNSFSGVAGKALAEHLSGIFLILHGAMVSESFEDVEGEILGRIRALPGAEKLPIFGVYDLHANFSDEMARQANCLVAYRENPHTDARQTAVRAARLLDRCLSAGIVPHSWHRRVPVVWTPSGTGTASDPMKALEALARGFEAEVEAVWAVNVNAGFAFADTRATGVSFSLSGTCPDHEARRILETIAGAAWERREEGCVTEESVEQVLDRILPVQEGPVVLVEPADNIGAGAGGDGTGLLRALLARKVEGAALAIQDARSAAAAIRAGAGSRVALAIGGRGSELDPGPVAIEAEVVSCSDGRFELEDRQSHLASMRGLTIEMGPCAVVRCDGVLILLTSRATPPFDLGQFRSQGVVPERMKIIGVKAAVAHRRAYDPIAKAMYWVDTPGPCSSRLKSFPFRRLARPIFPLDAQASWPMEAAGLHDFSL